MVDAGPSEPIPERRRDKPPDMPRLTMPRSFTGRSLRVEVQPFSPPQEPQLDDGLGAVPSEFYLERVVPGPLETAYGGTREYCDGVKDL